MKNAKADDQAAVPYENETEKAVHYRSIEVVSHHAGQPFECVQRLYEIVLIRLKRQARVKDFLPILVAKRTKELISKRSALSKNPNSVTD